MPDLIEAAIAWLRENGSDVRDRWALGLLERLQAGADDRYYDEGHVKRYISHEMYLSGWEPDEYGGELRRSLVRVAMESHGSIERFVDGCRVLADALALGLVVAEHKERLRKKISVSCRVLYAWLQRQQANPGSVLSAF